MKRRIVIAAVLVCPIALTSCSGDKIVTYSEFEQIRPNMTLAEAEKIVGQKATLLTDQEMDDAIVPTIWGEQVYFWKNKDDSDAYVAIVNNHVINKSETGLN